MLPVLCVLALSTPAARPGRLEGPAVVGPYSGLAGHVAVTTPRIDASVAIDGNLDEAPWQRAALLTGFSEYAPVDGRPAEDSTEVLVWYSATAIYFGIRAFEPHGPVHATLATRDHIAADDGIEILLDTFNDHRQAIAFGVNPLGVQSDGTLNETHAGTSDTVDLSTDFVFQSKGHLTDYGYEVEIRIPFKSIRYQPTATQAWGLQIIRTVQHSGHVQTWTPARRRAASFLAQSGTLEGLTDLHRDLVLDLNPEVTGKVDGAPSGPGWSYHHLNPDLGGNVRWGITNNLTLTGTVNPDFSQIEADASQLVFDPRDALFFPEKRPFFLEGLEQFQTPNNLVYTRALVQPVGAVKVTGKVGDVGIGFLSGADARAFSATGTDNPIYNILRARTDLGGQSTVGIVYTDKQDGSDWNRVAGADARVAFGGIYTLGLQAVESFTRTAGITVQGPLWQAALTRSGRQFGFTYSLAGIHPDFFDQSGFVARNGIAVGQMDHSITFYGAPGAAVESWTGDILLFGRWLYPHFQAGGAPDDREIHFNTNTVIKGWNVATGLFFERFGYDPSLYANYAIQRTVGGVTDTVPFVGTPGIRNLDILVQFTTPQFRRFDANLLFLPAIQDENFYEWSPARILILQAGVDWRPNDRIRIGGTYLHQEYWRRSDGSLVARQMIPRLKIEYQVSRPLFLRVVGQYVSTFQDSLRDDSRTNDPILIKDPTTGIYERATAVTSNGLRVDWLLAFTPSPGTVVYAGYGSSLTDDATFAFRGLQRTTDGFFAKVTYLFRL
ncbi:MAG TPA: DUF5916 domain-containing protein [Gemmatimonadales bacterium]|nr:DUF5916 domain-containing protein [Gemmatimonadales bacterium]